MKADRRRFLSMWAAAVALAHTSVESVETRRLRMQQSVWPSTFPALGQRVNGHPLTYLDSAATTLRPQTVIDAIASYYAADNANPSRAHTLARRAADRLSAAREAVARFINAADPAEIVFVRGTTEGINLVASTWGTSNLKRRDEVVLTVAEHASNLMPWTRAARQSDANVRMLDVDDEGQLPLDELKKILSDRTKVVAFSHVSNVLGFVNPVKEICALARQAGALTVVDGAQGAPHVRIDVQDLGCDFYVFSGHKMLGPMATGVVWGRRDRLDAIPPYHVGSNMAHAVDFERAEYEQGALKFQAGTPDVAGPVGLAAAVQFFETAGHERLRRHDQDLVEYGLARLAEIPRLRIIGSKRPAQRVPVFTFVIDGHSAASIARALDARGIAIRAGDMAALPLLKRFGATEAARASAYVYSTRHDLDRLADALRNVR
ncbi:MAG TPA: cysteine desulfurase [Vicinamibacterales bacterium]|nr:cysteine desulfurase [Vicinamibacterales bacterium]